MSRATVIARREIGSYFHSPIAYVAMTLFLVASGISFLNDFEPGQPAALRSIFDWMIWFLVLDRSHPQHGIALAGMGDRNHRNADDRAGR